MKSNYKYLIVIISLVFLSTACQFLGYSLEKTEKEEPIVETEIVVLPTASTPPTLMVSTLEPTPTEEIEPTPDISYKIGSTKIGELDGMEMVFVPAGNFIMGSNSGDVQEDEKPRHTVYLDAYWIDKYEVTNGQYNICVIAGACTPPEDTSRYLSSVYANHPVVFVTYDQAQAYCQWAGRELPTEAQWEKASRGENGNNFPWGNNAPTCKLANYKGCGGNTNVVGTYPAGVSPYGTYDMLGNVWEWVRDWYDEDYYNSTTEWDNPIGPETGQKYIMRGGSYNHNLKWLRSTDRFPVGKNFKYEYGGFRCAIP